MASPALSNNPAFSGKTLSAEELHRIYDQPAADLHRPGVDQAATGAAGVAAAATATAGAAGAGLQGGAPVTASDHPMTYENTIQKTVLLFVIVLITGAAGWVIAPTFPAIMFIGAIVGLALGLVNAFKREPSPVLIVLYAAAQGLFLGGISGFYEAQWPGIVSQAVIGTFAVFGLTLLLFANGKVRTSPRMTKIVLIAMGGYLIFSLINMVLMMTGVSKDPWGLGTGVKVFGIPLGIIVGVLAVLLAAYTLVMDFELIQNGVRNKVPSRWGWQAAFGLTVTLIWLYIEILRIIAIFRSN